MNETVQVNTKAKKPENLFYFIFGKRFETNTFRNFRKIKKLYFFSKNFLIKVFLFQRGSSNGYQGDRPGASDSYQSSRSGYDRPSSDRYGDRPAPRGGGGFWGADRGSDRRGDYDRDRSIKFSIEIGSVGVKIILVQKNTRDCGDLVRVGQVRLELQ